MRKRFTNSAWAGSCLAAVLDAVAHAARLVAAAADDSDDADSDYDDADDGSDDPHDGDDDSSAGEDGYDPDESVDLQYSGDEKTPKRYR